MKRTKIKELLSSKVEQEEVLVKGWVRTRRDSKGGFSFLEINDGSCLANIQVIVEHSLKDQACIRAEKRTPFSHSLIRIS